MKTKEEILAFIKGCQATYELGSVIDDRKQLQWEVLDSDNAYYIRAMFFIKRISPASGDPRYIDDVVQIDDAIGVKILKGSSLRKHAAEIQDILEQVDFVVFADI